MSSMGQQSRLIMKKTQLVKISILLLIGVFCLSSCQKDGVFNPKKKISKIYVQEEGEDEKVLSESWTWNKDKLVRIDMDYGNSIQFEYDGKQLSKIVLDPHNYTKCIYQGNKLDKMETYSTYFSSTVLVSVNTFKYSRDKISRIIVEDYNIDINPTEVKTINPLRFVLPQQLSEKVMEHLQMRKDGKKGTSTYNISLIWKGDNLEKMITYVETEGGIMENVQTYTYDNKNSPLYGLLYPIPVSSKNNVIKETYTPYQSDLEGAEFAYSYTYEDNYPKERKATINTDGVPYTLIQFYEYLK